jgi:copper chaperone CopZ
MNEQTIFVKEATTESGIWEVERILNQLNGIERVLVDTDDGEVKIEFDDKLISKEQIVTTLVDHDFTILH